MFSFYANGILSIVDMISRLVKKQFHVKITASVAFVLLCFWNVCYYSHITFCIDSIVLMIIDQYGMAGGHPQRSHPSQMLTDQSTYCFLPQAFVSYHCQVDKIVVSSHEFETYHIPLSTVLVALLACLVENWP